MRREALMISLKAECHNLDWLQIDTWENPTPYEAGVKNKRELVRILKKNSW